MLKDQDRIFQNLYNDLGPDVTSSQKRGDWINTKDLTSKGRDWIINEIKDSVMLQIQVPFKISKIRLGLMPILRRKKSGFGANTPFLFPKDF